MDKNAVALPIWESLGFGFCEIGGITRHAQPGNPKPRMFRAPQTEALINRMGFNNDGLDSVARRLADWKSADAWPKAPVAINLGKSKITPLEKAPQEYGMLLQRLWTYGDLFVVNVSSPNTPDLRKLQQADALKTIIKALESVRTACVNEFPNQPSRPIFLKVDPDMPREALNEILDACLDSSLNGIVATNTTLSRPAPEQTDTERPLVYDEQGGLSGRPLKQRSTDLIRHIYEYTSGKLPIIGVGGIFNAQDAWEKICAGASLLQVYSGMVYQGPTLARSIVEGLSTQVERHSLKSIASAVGQELPFKRGG
jgi:dihydroorotate dehydrogenase